MSIFLVLPTGLCVIGVVALIVAERIASQRLRFVSKPIASAAFVAIPFVTGALDGNPQPVALWITVGLVLGAVGDIALLFRRGLLVGLVAFLFGHVAYVVGFAHIVAPNEWLRGVMPAIAVVPLVLAAVVLRWLWPHVGAMRVPVIAYVAVISTMLIAGVAISVRNTSSAFHPLLLTAGAIAFFVSDLAVARERFVVKDRWNRYVGLPIYYGAQLQIAWAVSIP